MIINPVFKTNSSSYSRHYVDEKPSHFTYEIIEMAKDLSRRLKEINFHEEPAWHIVMEFFVLVSGVQSSEYCGVSYEVTSFIEKYINKYPDSAKELLLKHRNIGLSQVRKNIWQLLFFCAGEKIEFSEDICHELYQECNALEDNESLQKEMLNFLGRIHENKPSIFNKEQSAFFEDRNKRREDILADLFESIRK